MRVVLQELAQRFELQLIGDGSTVVTGVCNLHPGIAGCLSFLSDSKRREQLKTTQASVVIVSPRDAEMLRGPGLIAKDPYLAYARIAQLFDPDRAFTPGIHPRAVVADDADIGEGCAIGANAVIEAGARIGAGSFIGPGCVIGRDAQIGAGTRLLANVTLGARVIIGARCVIQPGAVIGSRGFGNAMSPQGWVEVPQLGSVRVGDDVEIGANTCIDRGTIDDTVIERGARLDNLIQIAHNCHIGEHTAIAACTGVAGSTRIGKRCMIGGAAGIAGHIEIADDVILLGRSMVTGSVTQRGVYGSGLPLDDVRSWRKTVARIRRLDRLDQRIKALERVLDVRTTEQQGDEH
ncbi:UDP-3-O-(3-hydroxymyristoyl)glucosamine N-acyltransferase [Sinimarinibacterium sp. NLF-5-8]|uniref:UDP-3-O-(3-hydroxymyristoyl)glucosamine N-acyltransferase n=1 Tax=Sinimarinibacterium sp. NLF-5-8 TaxID=2698684 RepID=UPI00137BF7E8|nr:UDP-3-O-(3-hydroxymyristoyl)glucosamine N-acyltransferase [Sinimarinibacterium sp. NLF-5-8]QHS08970.1 UDP-3-O-(3-hydroxymyristoyl)glucosamine N-acyltransferase [Sinimarinibacterium sp. NLF-5-8]